LQTALQNYKFKKQIVPMKLEQEYLCLIRPGAQEFVQALAKVQPKKNFICCSLRGNAEIVLKNLGIAQLFDAIGGPNILQNIHSHSILIDDNLGKAAHNKLSPIFTKDKNIHPTFQHFQVKPFLGDFTDKELFSLLPKVLEHIKTLEDLFP
jgi:hypothetical protein